jgi:hypothetical protein
MEGLFEKIKEKRKEIVDGKSFNLQSMLKYRLENVEQGEKEEIEINE